MSETPFNHNKNNNQWLDHYFYKLGVNVIPANSKLKRPIIPYKEYLDNPVLPERFETWKKEGKFKDGFIIILEKLWRSQHRGKYLIGIDIDKELGIKEFCSRGGKIISLQELSNKTVVEQHKDDLTKAHIYFISSIPFPLKSADTFVGIEIKKYIVPAPNIHTNGYTYEIIGDKKEPVILTAEQTIQLMRHIDNICTKYGLKYLKNVQSKILTESLRKLIRTLRINPQISIEECNRHMTLLSIADSLLLYHTKNKISEDKLREFFLEINKKLCRPNPLPEFELKSIWKSAVEWVAAKIQNEEKKPRQPKQNNKDNLIEQASKAILEKYQILTVEETREILYYQNGVYLYGGDILIEKEVEKLYGYSIRNSHINEIKSHIRRITFVTRKEFDKDLNIVNLKNGLYNIIEDKLEPHTPTYYSRNQKPIHFIPNIKPKFFGKFLSEVLYPQEIRTAVEMMAYTFLRNNPYEVYCILLGIGGNGKGVYTGIITSLHGEKNVSNVPLKSILNERFALADMENKDVNIDTELSTGIITDISILKKLTGKQPIRIERKNKDAYEVILHPKLFFSANKLPLISDDSDARYRREITLNFPNQFEGVNADPKLLEKLTTPEELSRIFNVLMKALRKILKNDGIYINLKTIQERRERHELIVNTVKAFVDKNLFISNSAEDYITKDNLYQGYVNFCKNNKTITESKVNFGKELRKLFPDLKDGKESSGERRTIWKGIRLVNWETNKQIIPI